MKCINTWNISFPALRRRRQEHDAPGDTPLAPEVVVDMPFEDEEEQPPEYEE